MVSQIPPKIQFVIQALTKQRQRHTEIVAALQAAESEVSKAGQRVSQLRAHIAQREADLAASGAKIPLEPFPEDAELARAEREQRILALRMNAPREQLKASGAEMERLKGSVDKAWLEFGREGYESALSALEAEAVKLQELLLAVAVFGAAFPSLRLPTPAVVVESVRSEAIRPGFMAPEPLIHTSDPVWVAKNNPQNSEAYAALRATKEEIDRLKAGD